MIGASMLLAYSISAYLPAIVAVYGKDVTLSGRTEIWSAVWRAIENRPFTGYGIDAAFQGPSTLVNDFYNRIGFVPAHCPQRGPRRGDHARDRRRGALAVDVPRHLPGELAAAAQGRAFRPRDVVCGDLGV